MTPAAARARHALPNPDVRDLPPQCDHPLVWIVPALAVVVLVGLVWAVIHLGGSVERPEQCNPSGCRPIPTSSP